MIKEIDKAIWEIEKEGKMNVPARVFATQKLIQTMGKDRTFEQLKNVSCLPGIVRHALLMPDGHEGYGFPIGGVAAFELENGIISPGGVGYDINCGVRVIATPLTRKEVELKKKQLIDLLFKNVPSGVGAKGKLRLTMQQLEEAVVEGVDWAIRNGFGRKEDKERTEENGRMEGADPSAVSQKAKERGLPQFGTVGAGNHFVEIQEVQKIFLPEVAKKFGLEEGKIVVMIHCGSRGFGHQVCDDYIRVMLAAAKKYNIDLPDPELCCAPINSSEAERYIKAMCCAVNYAFCNRHVMMHWVRETFDEVFGKGTGEEMPLVYDVCHNIAKFEEHQLDGKRVKLCVHRKGATRAFAAGRRELPSYYREIGQPVLIPGSMGTASYVLVGKEGAMKNSWGSSCHGAGRAMSRSKAVKTWSGKEIQNTLLQKGIMVKATEFDLLAEEAPDAYKNVDEVVEAVKDANLSEIVARLVPIGVVKG
ncbi:MAG: RtcB family protein [Candidatus Micrarchaeota archaeon]|nr:RtcB family protein [Candidatus Micrarchaeota archaeon]